MNHKVRDPFFRGDRQVDSMCVGFNTQRFDIDNGVSNFHGNQPDAFGMPSFRDMDFGYARGTRSMMPNGGMAPERAVAGDDNCDQPKCGNMGGVYRRCRKQGCTCTDMTVPNGECVSEKSSRGQIGIAQQKKMGLRDASGRKVYLTPQQVAQREEDPTGYGCEDITCGRYAGGGRKRCPSGCKCKNNVCVSNKSRVVQGNSQQRRNFTGYGRNFPMGDGMYAHGGVHNMQMNMRGNRFSNRLNDRDMSNGGLRLR